MTGGGSGGHITPLLSLAHELKSLDSDCQITYIGHKGDRFDSLKVSAKDFDFVSFIDGGKFRRYHGESLFKHLIDLKTLALNFRDFFKVIASVWRAFRILRRVKPDVVFSKGGFVVVPVGIAAHLLRIPIITHDSDTVPGLANRIVGRWAVVNATGMPAKYYNYPKDRVAYVGVPVAGSRKLGDKELVELRRQLRLPNDAQVLLISGGGNGSKRLNDLTVSIAPKLLESDPKLYIVHICGQSHEDDVQDLYKNLLVESAYRRIRVIGFTSEFDKYVAVADLIFGRAGATSLAEFALLGKACIIMPSPFLAGGHQLKNAEELSTKDAAVVIDEDTSGDELLVIVSELINNQNRREQLAGNISRLARPDAAKDLASIVLDVAKKGKS